VWTGRLLGAKGQPFLLGVAAVFLGRIGGALAGAVLPGVGLDAALLYTASFGMLELRSGRLWLGTPALAAMMPPLLAYSIAYLWGRRAQAGASTRAREDAPHGGKGQ
jgi:hypothetical protein